MKTDGNTATLAEREAAAAAAGQAELLVLLGKEQEARINAEARADEAEARGAEMEAAMRAGEDRLAAVAAEKEKKLRALRAELDALRLRAPTTPPLAPAVSIVSRNTAPTAEAISPAVVANLNSRLEAAAASESDAVHQEAPLAPPPAPDTDPVQATFVGHVKGSQYHKPSGSTSWTNLWKQKTGARKLPKCPCCIEAPVELSESDSIAGAHVMYRDDNNRLYVGIIPTCTACNVSGNMLRRNIEVVTIFDFGAQTFAGKLTTATTTPQKFDVCSKFSVTADSENVTYEMNGITSGKGRGFADGGDATFEFESTRENDDIYYLRLMLAYEAFHPERSIRNVRARQGHQEHNFSVFLLGQ